MPTTSGSRTSSQRKKKISKQSHSLDTSLKRRFQARLLKWYEKHGRDLPWRKTSDPYHILVSEVMLQQTQVDRVIPKYHEFLDRYPSFEELADAPVSDVKKTWYPLGYNIRPERLHSIACETVARYGGQLPSDAEELLSFKGIGRYTAGAIRSFAFNDCKLRCCHAPCLTGLVAEENYKKANGFPFAFRVSDLNSLSSGSGPACRDLRPARRGNRLVSW